MSGESRSPPSLISARLPIIRPVATRPYRRGSTRKKNLLDLQERDKNNRRHFLFVFTPAHGGDCLFLSVQPHQPRDNVASVLENRRGKFGIALEPNPRIYSFLSFILFSPWTRNNNGTSSILDAFLRLCPNGKWSRPTPSRFCFHLSILFITCTFSLFSIFVVGLSLRALSYGLVLYVHTCSLFSHKSH